MVGGVGMGVGGEVGGNGAIFRPTGNQLLIQKEESFAYIEVFISLETTWCTFSLYLQHCNSSIHKVIKVMAFPSNTFRCKSVLFYLGGGYTLWAVSKRVFL